MEVKPKRNCLRISVGAVIALLAAGAGADPIVADNFTLASGTGVATVNNTESSGVGTYSTIQGANGMSVTTVSGFGDGNVLSLANGTQTYYRQFDGATTLTLNSLLEHQTLRLAFDVRFNGSFAGADNFSFGFIDDSPANSVLYANVDLSSSGGTLSELRYRTGSFNMSDAAGSTIFGSPFTEPSTVSGQAYLLQLDITKQTDGGFLVEYFRDGLLAGSTLQGTSSNFTTTAGGLAISGIAFRHSQTPNVVTYLDNVTVAVIPEPLTGIFFLGGGAMLAYRRRWYRVLT